MSLLIILKLNGTRLEKRSSRNITKFQPRNGGQKTDLQLHQNTRVFRRITRPFSPLLIFPFTLKGLVSDKFHFKKKNPTFRYAGEYAGVK